MELEVKGYCEIWEILSDHLELALSFDCELWSVFVMIDVRPRPCLVFYQYRGVALSFVSGLGFRLDERWNIRYVHVTDWPSGHNRFETRDWLEDGVEILDDSDLYTCDAAAEIMM
jgi:hypothetical protein